MRARSPGRYASRVWVAGGCAIALAGAAVVWAADWSSLAKDGVHDPTSPAIGVLQEPAEALAKLPPDTAGNRVRWMRALDEGAISPRAAVLPDTRVSLRTTQILMRRTGEMDMVRFPHREHTAWLDCSNCHEQLFERKAGATKVNMFLILSGEKCGVCHGAVAFPLTECARCHSVRRGSAEAAAFDAGGVRP